MPQRAVVRLLPFVAAILSATYVHAQAPFRVLHHFDTRIIANNFGPTELVFAPDGKIYGTTVQGGAYASSSFSGGSFYVFDNGGAAGGSLVFRSLHDFVQNEGGGRKALIYVAGSFYGTTSTGIFRASSDGVITMLHTFAGLDGTSPRNLLIASSDGIYGLTASGGLYGKGTAYHLSITDGSFNVLHSFTVSEAGSSSSIGRIVEGADSNFFLTTVSGSTGSGAILKMDHSGNVTLFIDFLGPNGKSPSALIKGA